MTSLVVRRVKNGGMVKLRYVPMVDRVISEGVLKPQRVQVICPACGQRVEAVATDGRVKGYCATAKQYVDFVIETQPVHAETNAKISANMKERWQNPEYRAKQLAVRTGKHLTAEHKAKLSASRIGKHHTVETKAKISAVVRRWHNKQ